MFTRRTTLAGLFAAPMTAKAISAKLKSETPKAQLVA